MREFAARLLPLLLGLLLLSGCAARADADAVTEDYSGEAVDAFVSDDDAGAPNAVFAAKDGAGATNAAFAAKDGADATGTASSSPLTIITTIFPLYDFARQVGGDAVNVTLLLKPGMDSHSYEPTPRDIIAINEADLFLYVGGESDAWVERLLSGSEGVRTYRAMDAVLPLVEEWHGEGAEAPGSADGASGRLANVEWPGEDAEAEYDEHIWTSPVNAISITEGILAQLIELDPAREDAYRENQEVYEEKLLDLDNRFRAIVSDARERTGREPTLVFGDRFPFLYFAREYGIRYEAAFPGCNLETEPDAATLARLSDRIREEKIPLILYLELSSHKVADVLAENTGAGTALFHSCHNVTKRDMENSVTYLRLMERNAKVLEAALG